MARPRKTETERNSISIHLRVDEDLFRRLHENAERDHLSITEYIRRLLNEAITNMIVIRLAPTEIPEELKDGLRSCAGIGNNLNQLQRYLNSGGYLSEDLKGELRSTIYHLDRFICNLNQISEEFYGKHEKHRHKKR